MQCLARDPRQAPERFLAPISSICTTALITTSLTSIGLIIPYRFVNVFSRPCRGKSPRRSLRPSAFTVHRRIDSKSESAQLD